MAKGDLCYNYGTTPYTHEEAPGLSVFYKDDAGKVFHTYSTYGRGVEVMMGTYNMLDLTPNSRGEGDVKHKMERVRASAIAIRRTRCWSRRYRWRGVR